MSLLGDFRSGCLSGSDGPHWLIGNDDVAPVIDVLSDGIELPLVDSPGASRLSLLEMLSDASDNIEAVVEGSLGLLSDCGVGLSVEVPSLGVAGEGPVDANFIQHFKRYFSRVGSISRERTVLSADIDSASGEFLDRLEVEDAGAHQHLHLPGVELEEVQHLLGEVLCEGDGSIALPVSSD